MEGEKGFHVSGIWVTMSISFGQGQVLPVSASISGILNNHSMKDPDLTVPKSLFYYLQKGINVNTPHRCSWGLNKIAEVNAFNDVPAWHTDVQ